MELDPSPIVELLLLGSLSQPLALTTPSGTRLLCNGFSRLLSISSFLKSARMTWNMMFGTTADQTFSLLSPTLSLSVVKLTTVFTSYVRSHGLTSLRIPFLLISPTLIFFWRGFPWWSFFEFFEHSHSFSPSSHFKELGWLLELSRGIAWVTPLSSMKNFRLRFIIFYPLCLIQGIRKSGDLGGC